MGMVEASRNQQLTAIELTKLVVECSSNQKMKAEEAINELTGNCTDPIFIGYPYGLIEADKVARISNNEKESLKTMFLIKLKSKNIEKYLNSANAHEILDRISF